MLTNLFSIPDEVGPHEGNELTLMLAGDKPLAMFYEVVGCECGEIPEAEFQPHVDAGIIIKAEHIYNLSKSKPHKSRYVYYAMRDESRRIQRLCEISQMLIETDTKTTDALETEIGQLLGYTNREITVYLKHFKKMKPFKKALSIKL